VATGDTGERDRSCALRIPASVEIPRWPIVGWRNTPVTRRPDHDIELYRDEDAYRVFVDVPDSDREDVRVRWYDNRLVVSVDGSGDGGLFHHDVSVPRPVVVDDISATYRDDVLVVTLPVDDDRERPGRTIDLAG
jgi:HSP20 family protein